MGSCIAQGAQLSALWGPGLGGMEAGGRSKREGMYVNIQLIHFIVQQKKQNIVKQLLVQFSCSVVSDSL